MNFPRPERTYAALIRQAAGKLGTRLEAEVLFAHLSGRDRSWLYAHADECCEPELEKRYRRLIDRRCAGEPVAYLTGRREFYGREFLITPDVLIPRPETELLIDLALDLPLPEEARIVDLGTGSGCIALTLAAERPEWKVAASDLSARALEVARTNREMLHIGPVEFGEGDLFIPFRNRMFDLIVSNPPYVATDDAHLQRGDVRFEPEVALTAGADGLQVIERIVTDAPHYLAPGGWLALEHGYDQAEAVRELMRKAGYICVTSHRDLAGIERATLGRLIAQPNG